MSETVLITDDPGQAGVTAGTLTAGSVWIGASLVAGSSFFFCGGGDDVFLLRFRNPNLDQVYVYVRPGVVVRVVVPFVCTRVDIDTPSNLLSVAGFAAWEGFTIPTVPGYSNV